MRAPIALAALAVLAASLPVSSPASAMDGETCLGSPATIVDLDGGTVQGTDGDDVIVTAPDVTVLAGGGRDAVCVTGSGDADYVDVQDGEDLDIRLGGGYDTLHLGSGGAGAGSVDAGPGGAYLQIVPDRSLSLDLGHSSLSTDADATYAITGDWDVTASAKRVRMLGDAGPNHLRALDQSCHVSIEGGRGKDWLALAPNTIEVPDISCRNVTPGELLGEGGDDLLVGWTRNDRLIGGPGRDTAKGGFGRDYCRAEVRKSCER
jgi:Ca2+-binding RTX toxin-like protein